MYTRDCYFYPRGTETYIDGVSSSYSRVRFEDLSTDVVEVGAVDRVS